MKRHAGWTLGLVCAARLFVGCSAKGSDDERLSLPDRASFPLVANVFDRRCGTLDCHGRPERNLRLYGKSGLRLAPDDVPGSGDTTEAEYDASYNAVVGLEPELLSAVVGERGAAPERLTLVRKARGAESHKGGQAVETGDASDRCMTSWLQGAAQDEACAKGAEIVPPW